MSKYQPIADLKVKIREYQDKDGKTKGVWSTVGTMWSTEHGSSQFITLDSVPLNTFKDGERFPFDGRLSIFRREEFNNAESDRKMTQFDVLKHSKEDIDDKPIDLSEIPF